MQSKEKYGFVYIWRDKKYKRYYIGSHWGTKEDGYVCSSNWMFKSHKRRPGDFKRRILKIVKTNRKETYNEEQKWLDKIKHEELGKKYYNYSKEILVGNGDPWNKGKKCPQISKSLKKIRKLFLKEHPEIIEKQKKTLKEAYSSGKIKVWNKGIKTGAQTEELVEKRAQANKNTWANKSEEERKNPGAGKNLLFLTKEQRKKQQEATKKWLNSSEGLEFKLRQKNRAEKEWQEGNRYKILKERYSTGWHPRLGISFKEYQENI